MTIDKMASQLLQNNSSPKTSGKGKASIEAQASFHDILQSTKKQTIGNLKFSRHANERLAMRNINLSAEQMERLEKGTTKAREKGIEESLVMVDHLAFIVNVRNNTVITAVGDNNDSVFTNIDGAVIS